MMKLWCLLVVLCVVERRLCLAYEPPPGPPAEGDGGPPPEEEEDDCPPLGLLGFAAGTIPEECLQKDENGCDVVVDDCLKEDEEDDEETPTEETATEEPVTEEGTATGTDEGTGEVGPVDEGGDDGATEETEGEKEDKCPPLDLLYPYMSLIPEECLTTDAEGCQDVKPECLKEPEEGEEEPEEGTTAEEQGKPEEPEDAGDAKPAEGTEEEGAEGAGAEEESESSTSDMPIPNDESDGHEHCCWWATIGECEKNPYWMRPVCQKSCGTPKCTVRAAEDCAVSVNVDGCKWKKPAEGDMGTDGGYGNGGNGDMAAACENKHKLCNFWKHKGECEANAGYMDQQCRKACGKC